MSTDNHIWHRFLETFTTRVQVLGTTGAGKTTLIRQLLGTDPSSERFPSTSTAKTTTCDLEIIMAEGGFEAVVTFLPRKRIQTWVEECVAEALIAYIEGKDLHTVERKLFEHSEQRFRLSYLLGRLPNSTEKTGPFFSRDPESALREHEHETAHAIPLTREQEQVATLMRYLQEISILGKTILADIPAQSEVLQSDLPADERSAMYQIFLDAHLQTYPGFRSLVVDIMKAIESRFQLLLKGRLTYDEDGWPSYWIYKSEDRADFLVTVNQFSSNTVAQYGRLLTPLVQGIRVKGPFQPLWREGPIPRLALIDGEGLGHTPDTSMTLPTAITARFEHVDAIMLIDNAKQPMLNAEVALKAIVTGGHVSKLFICFTHFDSIEGDNFSDQQDKIDHLRSSIDNCITYLSKKIDPYSSIALSNRVEDHVLYLSNLNQKMLSQDESLPLNELIDTFEKTHATVFETDIQPVYKEVAISEALRQAVSSFREAWQGCLGLNSQSRRHPEYWSTIKALSRRVAELGLDEYKTLRPVADLIQEISEQIRRFLDKPLTWEFATYRSEDERLAVIDAITRDIYAQLHTVSHQRIILDCLSNWYIAWKRSGTGSTKVRANDIEQIYGYAAPLSQEVPAGETNALLVQVSNVVREAILNGGGKLL